ncbi:hypothetical protein L0152_16100, partial [bacterium]|nr:hypothetical protein [bacterium]
MANSNSSQIIDSDFREIKTPYAADKHYLPKVLNGEMDIGAVRKELREMAAPRQIAQSPAVRINP